MDSKKWKAVCGNRSCDFKTDDPKHIYCPLCGNLLLSKRAASRRLLCHVQDTCEVYGFSDEDCSRHEVKFQCIQTIVTMLESLDFAVRQLRIGLQSLGWKPPTQEELSDRGKGAGYASISKERMSDLEDG